MMTKKEAGRLGGLATVEKHGHEHMSKIGKKGAKVLYERYALRPYQLSKFALVSRETGQVKAIR